MSTLKQALIVATLLLSSQGAWAVQGSPLQLQASAADPVIPLSQHNSPHYLLVIDYQLYNPSDTAVSLNFDPSALAELSIEGLNDVDPLVVKAFEENIKLPLIIAAKQTLMLKGSSIVRAAQWLSKGQSYTLYTRLLITKLNNIKTPKSTVALEANFNISTQ